MGLRARRAAAAFAVVLAAGCVAISPTRKHPDYATQIASLQKLGIMSVRAKVARRTLSGEWESLTSEADDVADEVLATLRTELAPRSIATRLVPDDPSADADLYTAVDLAVLQAFRSSSRKDRGAFSGMQSQRPQLRALAASIGADALLFASFQEYIHVGVPTIHYSTVEILVAEAATGDVVYVGRDEANGQPFGPSPARLTSAALKDLRRE